VSRREVWCAWFGFALGAVLALLAVVPIAMAKQPTREVKVVHQVPVVRLIECSRADLVDTLRPYDETGMKTTKGGTK
jgi:hypothetical protein